MVHLAATLFDQRTTRDSANSGHFYPFSPDPDFVDHGTILDIIAERMSTPASRVTLVGTSGVRSVQSSLVGGVNIADNTEANHSSQSNSVTGSDPGRQIPGCSGFMPAMLLDLSKVSGRLQIRSRYLVVGIYKRNVFQLVENWLQDTKPGDRVLGLDNADDNSLLRTDPGQTQQHAIALTRPLQEFLHRSTNGPILITTHNKEVALRTVDPGDLIEIGPLDKSEAIELLRRTWNPSGSLGDLRVRTYSGAVASLSACGGARLYAVGHHTSRQLYYSLYTPVFNIAILGKDPQE